MSLISRSLTALSLAGGTVFLAMNGASAIETSILWPDDSRLALFAGFGRDRQTPDGDSEQQWEWVKGRLWLHQAKLSSGILNTGWYAEINRTDGNLSQSDDYQSTHWFSGLTLQHVYQQNSAWRLGQSKLETTLDFGYGIKSSEAKNDTAGGTWRTERDTEALHLSLNLRHYLEKEIHQPLSRWDLNLEYTQPLHYDQHDYWRGVEKTPDRLIKDTFLAIDVKPQVYAFQFPLFFVGVRPEVGWGYDGAAQMSSGSYFGSAGLGLNLFTINQEKYDSQLASITLASYKHEFAGDRDVWQFLKLDLNMVSLWNALFKTKPKESISPYID